MTLEATSPGANPKIANLAGLLARKGVEPG